MCNVLLKQKNLCFSQMVASPALVSSPNPQHMLGGGQRSISNNKFIF